MKPQTCWGRSPRTVKREWLAGKGVGLAQTVRVFDDTAVVAARRWIQGVVAPAPTRFVSATAYLWLRSPRAAALLVHINAIAGR